jgi:hypothetical protein
MTALPGLGDDAGPDGVNPPLLEPGEDDPPDGVVVDASVFSCCENGSLLANRLNDAS